MLTDAGITVLVDLVEANANSGISSSLVPFSDVTETTDPQEAKQS
jgi:hypothetical protein